MFLSVHPQDVNNAAYTNPKVDFTEEGRGTKRNALNCHSAFDRTERIPISTRKEGNRPSLPFQRRRNRLPEGAHKGSSTIS